MPDRKLVICVTYKVNDVSAISGISFVVNSVSKRYFKRIFM